MEHKLKEVLSNVFECDVSEITENISQDSFGRWDSLHHMKLIVALEEAFSISFSDEEVVDLLDFKLIRYALKEKGLQF